MGTSEEFWGTRGGGKRLERATRQGDEAVDFLTPLLEADERLSVLLADVSTTRSLGRSTIALSARRIFIISWDRQGHCAKTRIADRDLVSARLVTNTDGIDAVRVRGPWGAVTLDDIASNNRAREIVELINAC